jgi:hypothetical protein
MTLCSGKAKCYCGEELIYICTPKLTSAESYYELAVYHDDSLISRLNFRAEYGAASMFGDYMIKKIVLKLNRMAPQDRPSCYNAWFAAANRHT